MRILSWNIRVIRGATEERLNDIASKLGSLQADIILLQEVSNESRFAAKIRRSLHESGYENIFLSADACANDKPYGNLIATKSPLKFLEHGVLPIAPWPQFLARACVDVGGFQTQFISVHMPNGSQNGWDKVRTFKALADYVRNILDQPCVFGGDFNEPRKFRPDGTIISFGHRRTQNGEFTLLGNRKDKSGETGPREEWHKAVCTVLVPGTAHQLTNVFTNIPGWVGEATHVVRGFERCFDHLFVSADFLVRNAGYDHGCTNVKLSDHSAIWADLELVNKRT
jgi:exodeoxyribonuclease III